MRKNNKMLAKPKVPKLPKLILHGLCQFWQPLGRAFSQNSCQVNANGSQGAFGCGVVAEFEDNPMNQSHTNRKDQKCMLIRNLPKPNSKQR